MRRFYLLSIIAVILAAFLISNGIVKSSYADQSAKASVTKLIQLSQKYAQQGNWAEAKRCAKKAVQADPNSDAAWNNYDKVLLQSQKATQTSSEENEEENALEGC